MAGTIALLATAMPSSAQQPGPISPQASPQSSPLPPAAEETAAAEAAAPAPDREADAAPPRDAELLPPSGLRSWTDRVIPGSAERYAALPMLPAGLPETITIPAGTRIPIVLETPLSSRFSRQGQAVIFRTSSALALGPELELPPGVEIRGRLAEVTRPGVFGKSGALRVTVEQVVLPGAPAAGLRAQLRSANLNARGRLTTEGRRSLNLQSMAILSLQGTLAGARFGGKAAGIGAGAGAAVAAVLMMSQRGNDASVSAGTPFSVRLQQDAELPARAVYWAQQDYARAHTGPFADSDWDAGFESSPRPVLKRRATSPQP